MFLQIFPIFGLAGTGLVVLAIGTSSLRYQGRQGERFSLLNHFISELGEVGVSPAARFFNIGFVIGGLALLPYMVGLGLIFKSLPGWLGAITGIIAALGVSAVGIFPMNNIQAHSMAAMTYFRAGLVMVVFFGLAIVFQPEGNKLVPQAANLLSLLSFAAYTAFLLLLTIRQRKHKSDESLDPQVTPQRPRIWLLPILEWVVFFTTIIWLFGMTFFI
jgi:hypothetical membrane protein